MNFHIKIFVRVDEVGNTLPVVYKHSVSVFYKHPFDVPKLYVLSL